MCVCVVCVRAGKCVCVLVRACVVVDARTRECTCARVALLIQHATLRHIVICGLSGSTTFFWRYLIIDTIFEKKKLWNIKRVFWFSLEGSFQTFLILRRIQRDTDINVKSLHVKRPFFLSDCNETWISSINFRKKSQISSFIKIRPVKAELFHADKRRDGRTDGHDEANRHF